MNLIVFHEGRSEPAEPQILRAAEASVYSPKMMEKLVE